MRDVDRCGKAFASVEIQLRASSFGWASVVFICWCFKIWFKNHIFIYVHRYVICCCINNNVAVDLERARRWGFVAIKHLRTAQRWGCIVVQSTIDIDCCSVRWNVKIGAIWRIVSNIITAYVVSAGSCKTVIIDTIADRYPIKRTHACERQTYQRSTQQYAFEVLIHKTFSFA